MWDLTSNEADMMISAWRTGNKLAWNVSCGCHTYLVNEVLIPGVPNLEVSLLGRFVGFFRSLQHSPSNEVVVTALLASRDVRSSLGKKLQSEI